MSSLALTIVSTLAAVRVSIMGAAPNAPVTLMRTDANGARSVRQPLGTITDGNGDLEVLDYEPALTGSIVYSLAGAASAITPAPRPANPVIHAVAFPALRYSDALLGWTESREGMTRVVTVLGRPDPLVILGGLRLRTGTGTTRARSYQDARALVEVLASSPVMVRQPCFPGLDLYAVITQTTVAPADHDALTGWGWPVVFGWSEMDPREVSLQAEAVWTIGAADDAFDTIGQAGEVFATLRDYAIGPPA